MNKTRRIIVQFSAKQKKASSVDKYLVLICSIQFLLPVLFTGPVITYDSQGYLSSAKSLFSSQFDNFYIFFRYPGYPLFLKTVLELSGHSFRLVIIAQSALVALSTFFLLRMVYSRILNNNPVYRGTFKVIAFICTFQIGIIGYSSAALQQALFVAITNMTLAYAMKLGDTLRFLDKATWAIILLISYSISPVLTVIPFTALLFRRALFQVSNRINYKSILGGVLTLVLIVLPTVIFAFSWNRISNESRPNNPSAYMGRDMGIPELIKFPGWLLETKEKGIDALAASFLSQSGLIPSTGWHGIVEISNPAFYENRVHAEYAFLSQRKSGLYDSANNASWVEYAKDMYVLDSALLSLPNELVLALSLMTYIIKLLWIFSPFFLIILFVFPRIFKGIPFRLYLLAVLPVVIFAYSYVLLGAQADRYALPAFMPLTLIILVFFSQLHFEGKSLMRNSRQDNKLTNG